MNHPLTTLPSSDPSQILRYRDRQYAAELITAALMHADFFTWLHQRTSVTSEEICAHFGFAQRPVDVLLTLCRANNLLTTDDDHRHHLTAQSVEYFVSDSPWFMGPYYQPIKDTPIVLGFLSVLRSGKPANWQAKDDAHDWHASMLDPEFARNFTALMNCRGRVFGQFLAKALAPHIGARRHLLDVGGGSGIYASALVAAYPELSASVLEQSPVDSICRQEIANYGLEDKITVIAADMFAQDWPTVDMILFSNVLHDWDFPEVKILLQKATEVLTHGGLLIIHDAFINDDKCGPLAVAEYSSLLMNITQGKCYSPQEYAAMLTDLGYEIGQYQDTIGDRGFMTAVKI
jgi:SAM-dependent methyltransferase